MLSYNIYILQQQIRKHLYQSVDEFAGDYMVREEVWSLIICKYVVLVKSIWSSYIPKMRKAVWKPAGGK